ncbi:MAG: hypothetical protein GW761_00125 [Leptospira sp.]|nr:hypothetical protein [Leptospira sp.]
MADSGTRKKTYSVKANYLSNETTAEALANYLHSYYKYSRFTYAFSSFSDYSLGSFVTIQNSGLGIDVKGRIVAKNETEKKKYFDYVVEQVSEYTAGLNIEQIVLKPANNPNLPSGITPEDLINGFEDEETGATTVPAELTNVIASSTFRNIYITFKPQELLTNFKNYEIQVSDDLNLWYSLSNNGVDWKGNLNEYNDFYSTEYVHINVPNVITGTGGIVGRTLHYRVRIRTKANVVSDWSVPVNATTYPIVTEDIQEIGGKTPQEIADTQPPTPVETFILTPVVNSNGTISLSWTEFEDDLGVVTGYTLWRAELVNKSDKKELTTANVLSYLDTTTEHNTSYFFGVSAYDNNNNESAIYWLETLITASNTTIPNAPTDIVARVEPKLITISFAGSSKTRIEKKIGAGSYSSMGIVEGYSYTETIGDIEQATVQTYTYRLTAISPFGVEATILPEINTYTFINYGTFTPAIPTGFTVKAIGKTTYLSWDKQTDLRDFDKYELQVNLDSGTTWYSLRDDGVNNGIGTAGIPSETTLTSYSHSNLSHIDNGTSVTGRTYYYRIRQKSSAITSGWTTTVSATTVPNTASDIVNNAIRNSHIIEGEITAEKMNVVDLAAISGIFGSISDGGNSLQGDAYNYWYLEDIGGKKRGAFRIGDVDSYLTYLPAGDIDNTRGEGYVELQGADLTLSTSDLITHNADISFRHGSNALTWYRTSIPATEYFRMMADTTTLNLQRKSGSSWITQAQLQISDGLFYFPLLKALTLEVSGGDTASIGIGVAPNAGNSGLRISKSYNGNATRYGIQSFITITDTPLTANRTQYGIDNIVINAHNETLSGFTQTVLVSRNHLISGTSDDALSNINAGYAGNNYILHRGRGTITNAIGEQNHILVTRPNSIITKAYASYNYLRNLLGTTSNGYGVYNNLVQESGTFGTAFGVYNRFAGTFTGNKWGIYSTGDTHNYLTGSLGIGTTTLSEKLTVSGNIRLTGDIKITNGKYIGNDIVGGIQRIYPYRTLPALQAGTNRNRPYGDGMSLESDQQITFIESDTNNTVGWIDTNAQAFQMLGTIDATGKISTSSQFVQKHADFRMEGTSYGFILRNDGSRLYMLNTASGDPTGTWNTNRPFSFALETGNLYLANSRVTITHATGNISTSGTISAEGQRVPKITVSPTQPTTGTDGDVWFKVP